MVPLDHGRSLHVKSKCRFCGSSGSNVCLRRLRDGSLKAQVQASVWEKLPEQSAWDRSAVARAHFGWNMCNRGEMHRNCCMKDNLWDGTTLTMRECNLRSVNHCKSCTEEWGSSEKKSSTQDVAQRRSSWQLTEEVYIYIVIYICVCINIKAL